MTVQWSKPWEPFDTPSRVAAFEAELQCELPPGHCLHGLPLRAIGCRPDRDDALFSVEDGSGRVARVHLTWIGRQERLPGPVAILYDGVAAWVADEERADA